VLQSIGTLTGRVENYNGIKTGRKETTIVSKTENRTAKKRFAEDLERPFWPVPRDLMVLISHLPIASYSELVV
jgi:hypothetical protein